MMTLNKSECRFLNFLIDELHVADVNFSFVDYSDISLRWFSDESEVEVVKQIIDGAKRRSADVLIGCVSTDVQGKQYPVAVFVGYRTK